MKSLQIRFVGTEVLYLLCSLIFMLSLNEMQLCKVSARFPLESRLYTKMKLFPFSRDMNIELHPPMGRAYPTHTVGENKVTCFDASPQTFCKAYIVVLSVSLCSSLLQFHGRFRTAQREEAVENGVGFRTITFP